MLRQNSIRRVAAALFSLRHPKNFENEKIVLCLKIAEIDMGFNVWSRRTILDIKVIFLKLSPFSGGKWSKVMPHSVLPRGIL